MVVKFGVIGCGNIGKRHAQHIINHPEGELIGAYDINENAIACFNDEHKLPTYNTFEDLLKNKEIDIINICTPNGVHHKHAIEALNSNKHVLVEKPILYSLAEN